MFSQDCGATVVRHSDECRENYATHDSLVTYLLKKFAKIFLNMLKPTQPVCDLFRTQENSHDILAQMLCENPD